ncbi:MAG: hypothetical protein FWB79_05180 [Treponema sp.]|nr:hypothetical protein [Treponema sp.]
MKNTLRFLGIVAVSVIIGVSFAGCRVNDDGDVDLFGASGSLSFESALRHTWVGDEENGTLIFTASGVESPSDSGTNAGAFALGLNFMVMGNIAGGATTKVSASGGNITVTVSAYGQSESEVWFTYTISGQTLTIRDEDDGEVIFVGTR